MAGANNTRGLYAKTPARRAEILRAAAAAFAEHGYAATSLRDVARRSGLTQAGLQHHYPNKEILLADLLEQRDADEEQSIRERADTAPMGRGADSLTESIRALIHAHQQDPEMTGLWAELAIAARRPDHPAHDYMVDRYRRVRIGIEAAFQSWADEGELRTGLDPSAGAALFTAVLDGLQAQWLLDPSVDINEPIRQFLQVILEPDDPA